MSIASEREPDARGARPTIDEYAASLPALEGAALRPRIPYREVVAALRALSRSPRARVLSAGESVRGEPIWRVDIEPSGARAADAGTLFVVAGIHATEHAGVAAALAILRRAAAGEGGWERRRVVAIPLANPDGFRDVETDLAAGRRWRFRRANARGVDLNRNFPVSYRRGYYLHRALPKVFSPGGGPLSEPEARAVDGALAAAAPAYAVSLHAFGDWIFLPYAARRRRPPDYPELLRLGREMAGRQPGRGYRVVQVGRLAPFFAARGAEIDHMYETYGARAFLIEIGAGPRPWRPKSWLGPYAWFNAPHGRFERDVARAVAAVEHLAAPD